ncbi:MAG: hypothetical protein PWR27_483 [Petroclostridium sp.]|jgi:glycosyltransferase involved in cell wall biosynthesis|nr:epsD 2 [Clostridia bacterium]MDK2809774.1 hypothetical protein [Petroclostridium sp.]
MIKVIHVLSDTNIGGAGRWLLNFLKYVDREKFLVKVVLPQGSLLKSKIEELKIESFEVPGMADRSFDIQSIKALYKIVKRERAQVVHTHASLSARIAARMAGVKAIIHTKHCIDQDIKKGVKRDIIAAVNTLLSHKIIAVAQAAKENLIASGMPEHRITVIHNGVEKLDIIPLTEREKIRAKWNIKPDDVVVGIVARLEEIKGHCYFIEAAHLVVDKNKRAKFLIVGTGSREEELKKQVKSLGLEEKVIFTGHIQDVGKIMNIIDINVISSLSEALCLSLIEGMSVGKPCIATNTGGNPEVVLDGQNGLLVPVKDVPKLAEAILKLVEDDKLREQMGMRGKKFMEEHFTAQAMTKKIEKTYEELIMN